MISRSKQYNFGLQAGNNTVNSDLQTITPLIGPHIQKRSDKPPNQRKNKTKLPVSIVCCRDPARFVRRQLILLEFCVLCEVIFFLGFGWNLYDVAPMASAAMQ